MTTSFASMPRNRALMMFQLSSAVALALMAMNADAQSVALTSLPPVAEVQVAAASAGPVAMTVEPVPVVEAPEEEWKPTLKVGDATRGLLALQGSGAAASSMARLISGDAAGRSYQRYIKSFEYAIPEKFGAAVKSSGLNSGSQ